MAETETTYLTRRARQERANAADATSPVARTAHLKLALQLVRAATEPQLWRAWSARADIGEPFVRGSDSESLTNVDSALAAAFPLPSSGTFEDLLKRLD